MRRTFWITLLGIVGCLVVWQWENLAIAARSIWHDYGGPSKVSEPNQWQRDLINNDKR